MVGAIVISIVATAGMTSTTYVQFIKGGLLVVFSTVLVIAVCVRGLTTTPDQGGSVPFYEYKSVAATLSGEAIVPADPAYRVVSSYTDAKGKNTFVKMEKNGTEGWWKKDRAADGSIALHETQYATVRESGEKIINGAPASAQNKLRQVGNLSQIEGRTGDDAKTGSVGPVGLLAIMSNEGTKVNLWKEAKFENGKDKVAVYYAQETPGKRVLRPGLKFKLEGTFPERMDFVSLMLALFLGTAALPHILIRYYTVPSPACARKSTIVAIAAIGFFYVLTLFMGVGAMTSAVVNPLDNNMSAPLLARSFGELLFAVISAIAFATVLGTVSGLIVAASGAVAHDLVDRFGSANLQDKQKVRIGKISAVIVGVIAIFFGIIFQGVNVTFLVGLAFAVAASANLPSILMLLFWKKTTSAGIVSSILVGIVSSIGFILLSPPLYALYGLDKSVAPIQMENPAIFSVPLSFLVLVVVSLFTQKQGSTKASLETA
jgi:cation/acetate symporter